MNGHSDMLIQTPRDALRVSDEGMFSIHLYIAPSGVHQINEVSDTIYRKGAKVPYHVHVRGYETFVLDKGRAEATIYGKRCLLEAGDMIQIEPYMPHGFTFLEEGCVWRELFHEMDMAGAHRDKYYLSRGSLEKLSDSGFLNRLRSEHGQKQLCEPIAELVEKWSLPQICPKSRGQEVFSYQGATCRLKVGRWQMKGLKEIWEYELERGLCLSFFTLKLKPAIYIVKSGRVQLEAAGEVLTAEEGDILHVPPFTAYRLTALDEGTVLHDYNCTATLFRFLEEYEAALAAEGGCGAELLAALKERNGVSLTSCQRVPV